MVVHYGLHFDNLDTRWQQCSSNLKSHDGWSQQSSMSKNTRDTHESDVLNWESFSQGKKKPQENL